MRLTPFLVLAYASAAHPLIAQTPPARSGTYEVQHDGRSGPRAALGITTRATGSPRDTLGVLVSAVVAGSPAERAGLEEGNRIAAINGVTLRATAADIADAGASDTFSSRLVRELGKVKPGDEVELRIYRDGKTSAVTLRTADADSLFGRGEDSRPARVARDDRPSLGIAVGSTGSRRDSLGVFVMRVADSTPAAMAGIEEGQRIAAINGVSLRLTGDESADREMGAMRVRRLQREVANLTPGRDVTLRVYGDGRLRDVRFKVGRAGDLARRSRTGMARSGVPEGTRRSEDGDIRIEVGGEIRQQLDALRRELDLLGPEIESLGPVLERLRPALERVQVDVPNAIRRARAGAMSGITVI